MEYAENDMSARLTKKQLRVIAHQALLREQKKNLLAFVDPHREIEVLPEGLQTGHVKWRKRGARSDRDCIGRFAKSYLPASRRKRRVNTWVYRGRRGKVGAEIMLRMRGNNLILLTSATSKSWPMQRWTSSMN